MLAHGLLVLLGLVVALGAGAMALADAELKAKICIGTNGRMSVPSNREHHYRNLRDRYINCTYVDGNLELTWVQDKEDKDLSFLQHIREVTGYVLISHVDVRRVILPNLQIIRGRTLFKIATREEEFALVVMLSNMYSVELPSLRDTLNGSIGLFNNYNLCHVNTINWKEVISNGQFIYEFNFNSPVRECPPCHKSCVAGCWGDGPENCQKFSKENCSPQCYQGRCFGSNPRECCHLFCAGGCSGPTQSDCLACRNFYDEGVCKQECPPMQVYNSITYSWEPNPKGKYAYGATCVKKCPEHLLKDNGACVRSCPPKKTAKNGECVPCNGPCPKTCKGEPTLHAGNIDNFKDCTIVEGSITILDQSFKGYQHVYANYSFGERYPEMHPRRLSVFNTLREITGYLNIQAYHEDFKDLSYFRNLEVIGGRNLYEYFSLYIVKTSLVSLELKSLKKVNSGSIIIVENRNLCFAGGIKWDKIKQSTEFEILLQGNRERMLCELDNLVCDEQCTKDGCWGAGTDQCLSCQNFKFKDQCLQNCSVVPRLYQHNELECKECHEQCGTSCHGPSSEHCDNCKNVKDGPYCVESCPLSRYESEGECRNCPKVCVDGCTGPLNTVGEGGCNSCDKAIINGDVTIERCLEKNEPCPDSYYHEWVGPQEEGPLKRLSGKAICRKCHPRCKKCTAYGFHLSVCQTCTNYKRGETCEDECPSDHYADEQTQECFPCDAECRGCTGSGPDNCSHCQNIKVFLGGEAADNRTAFNCTSSCPADKPFKLFPDDNTEPYCSEEQVGMPFRIGGNDSTRAILLITVGLCLVIVTVVVVIFFAWCKRIKTKENAVKMSMTFAGLDDNEPLRPSNVKPNLAKLRIINETEMRRGGVLGYGAFGTVFKGVWVPEGENTKIPVAIKVLRESTGQNATKEFLEEAYIMATVDHPNLLQLLAVCLGSQMMLITQLMPLGCLLDFVRNHKERIGSKALLNWCTQIARGMAYLEEKRLVHRDLAARNVLVQTPSVVKITDFGLAKLLDINEDEYKAAGGKMPIKWLALECIQHRIFTHKSDVWAFGVTLWELLTYGGRPYETVPAREVPDLLEKGERLPQPPICTIDVYMIMIKCWMLDAESRPTFKELAEDFAKMARDPGRYLVIKGDKFMRLPNYGQDDKSIVRSLASGPESTGGQSETDEYPASRFKAPFPSLQPASSASEASGSCPSAPPNQFWSPSASHGTSDGSCAPQNQHNWSQELVLRYGAAAAAAALGVAVGESSSSSRYCSDPLKSLGEDDSDGSSRLKNQAQIGSLKLELPLDEDDYLMPSPQQAQTATAYVDLIGDAKQQQQQQQQQHLPDAGKYPDFLAHTALDNPEYLMNQDNVPSQTIGIPTVSELVQCADAAAAAAPTPNGGTALAYLPQRSSEEESDHEYYNDFDRLQRELQPLRKNETTV